MKLFFIRMPPVVLLGILGAIAGLVVAWNFNPLPINARRRLAPAAYRLPKIPGGTALRLAMVHDVLHERYYRHGVAWYAKRNEESKKIIAATSRPTQQSLDAMDDLAIGLERIGQGQDAIAVAREKLKAVSPLPDSLVTRASASESEDTVDAGDLQRILAARNLPQLARQQYTACANLGTLLVHGYMPAALQGDQQALRHVREGLDWIEKAIALNPGAHFGRETWQAICIEDMLAAIEHPEILTKYDLIGDDLDGPIGLYHIREEQEFRYPVYELNANASPAERVRIRGFLLRVGMDPVWVAMVQPDYTVPMPFDEPTLAIIGMWTMGGGPNPHFALTLGRLMQAVGQNEIAWNAYERAVEMKDQFWPDKAVCDQMVSLCRDQQQAIAQDETGDETPQAWEDRMRQVHRAELAWGLAQQKAYQDFEAKQIAAGVALDDPNFYTVFYREHPPIASAPGQADDFAVVALEPAEPMDWLPCVALGCGVGMVLGVWISELRNRSKKTASKRFD